MSLLIDILMLMTAWTHVLLTPFTKVEESFNLHATHDVLMYGLDASNLTKYDHFVFPGAVPRSFLGSIILALSSLPIIHALNTSGLIASKADLQIIVRLVLATLNAVGLCILRRAVSKRFGVSTGAFFAILSCTQFHLPFWMGRTLPNMFALLPVNIAYSYIIDRMPNSTRPAPQHVRRAIALLTFTAVVFRAEILLVLGPLVLHALVMRWISFRSVIRTGLITALLSISLTTLLDSYLWSNWPLWPELHSIYFNVYQNKSTEWGVSPYHAYFTSHLPKLLLTAAPLAALGVLADARVRSLLVAPIVFVTMMSALGHKEWRFVVYVVPLFNVAAARGAYWLTNRRARTLVGRLGLICVLGCIIVNVLITSVLTRASMANYPGGAALSRLNELIDASQNVHVHISNLAAQTGASLFLHTHADPLYPLYLPHLPPLASSHNWVYNKTENLTPHDITAAVHFTHAIVETAATTTHTVDGFPEAAWENVGCVRAFDGFRVRRAAGDKGKGIWETLPSFSLTYSDKLCILRRR